MRQSIIKDPEKNNLIASDIRIIRSRRKTISIQIDENLRVTVRAPLRMPDAAVQKFIEERSAWIEKHMQKMKDRQEELKAAPEELLTMEEIRALANEAADYIPERVSFYARKIGVNYGRITIRNQKSRWGSCSSKGNLNFNCLLMLTPAEVIDYVVVHELCHRLEMNHSRYFWAEVERVLPDYKKWEKWLKNDGEKIMRRMISG
ncbi:MAG: M48 family metallopeptidase [Lachnospiraceae bacterium]|nr:M48 family metallopeptidase [Lachnospiraceae bacterium]